MTFHIAARVTPKLTLKASGKNVADAAEKFEVVLNRYLRRIGDEERTFEGAGSGLVDMIALLVEDGDPTDICITDDDAVLVQFFTAKKPTQKGN